MKKLATTICILGLAGCATAPYDSAKPLGRSDTMKIDLQVGHSLWTSENRDRAFIEKLIEFANSLPDEWTVPPGHGPSAFYYLTFSFYHSGTSVGVFGVGTGFFSRSGDLGRWQPASKNQVDALSALVGFDIWAFIEQKANQTPKPTRARFHSALQSRWPRGSA